MNYRTLGKTGEKVSVLGFGCMRLPVIGKDMKNIDLAKTIQMIRYAIDHGVNYIDTAYVYHEGKSEEAVAKALQDGYRGKVFVATKLPIWDVKKYADMERLLDEQLHNLKTDRIDFYLVHSLNRSAWAKLVDLGILDFLREVQQKGKVKHLGFSFHDEYSAFEEIVDSFPWSFCQIQLNYLDETFQAGEKGLEYAASRGLGVVIMEPLRGGNLVNALIPQAKEIMASSPIQKEPAQWALEWVWNHPDVGVVLSGINEMDQVMANIRYALASEQPMSPEEKEVIQAVQNAYLDKMQIACTSCNYCMPCPSGVDIPQSFEFFNRAHMMEDIPGARFWYSRLPKASSCVACGQCEEHCPQNIPIINKLQEVVALFEAKNEA